MRMLKQPRRIDLNAANSKPECSPIKKKAIEIPYIYKHLGKDRDRGKRLWLLSCLLIETDSTDDHAQPAVPCSSRFRSRLTTIRPERIQKHEQRGSM